MTTRDQTILITGGTGGIGKEVATMLARGGVRIVITGRDRQRTQRALADIKLRSGSTAVSALACDFASQTSIRRLADAFLHTHERLDVLINNAGGVHSRRELTEDGIEMTFAVNHLGYFLLTDLLLDRLKASAPARIVNVASRAHYRGTLDLDDIGFENDWRIMRAYARSKLANVLFTRALAKRLCESGVTVNAVHPGVVGTNIWDHGAPRWAQALFRVAFAPVKHFYMRTPEDGAGVVARLAVSTDVAGQSGLYFDREHVAEPSETARDDALAERLWSESERLTAAQPYPRPAV